MQKHFNLMQSHLSIFAFVACAFGVICKKSLQIRSHEVFALFFLINLYYFRLCWVFIAVRAFSSCGERGLLFVVVHGLLVAVASLVAEHGL